MPHETIFLSDSASGATASILTLGFNCFHFQASPAGTPVEVLWADPNFTSGTQRPSGSGIPLLFPFPGRIQGTVFTWEGKTYQLQPGDSLGNAIHGFVHSRPWRVLEATPQRAVGVFQAAIDDPSLLAMWPADFKITATYELTGNTLRSHFLLENPDPRHPLPCGFGTHGYFSVPLGGTSAEACRVTIPARQKWRLREMLVTGERESVDAATLQAGLPFGEMQFDDCFTDLVRTDGMSHSRISDPHSGRTLSISFDEAFRECVVYNPRHRQAVCIEPLTCPPDPFRLSKLGIDAGLRLLAPGESFETRVEMRLD